MSVFKYKVEVGNIEQTKFESVELIVDTASTYTWIPEELATKLGLKTTGRRTIKLADGTEIIRSGVDATIKINDEIHVNFCILAKPGDALILGSLTLETFSLGVDPLNKKLIPIMPYAMSTIPCPFEFDYSNCLTEKVKDEGITKDEISVFQEKVKEAHQKLNETRKTGEIGFLELPYKIDRAREIKRFVENEIRYKFDNFLAIGIGGSILGNIALFQALKHPQWNLFSKKQRKGYLRFFAADNVDPQWVKSIIDVIDIKKTIINVISKSGTTTESLANFFIFLNLLKKKLGKKYTKNIIITTDPDEGFLLEFAKKHNIKTYPIEKKVTGRFSTLSCVALISSAALGIDIIKLLNGAQDLDESVDTPDIFKNLPALYAVIQYLFYTKGKKIHVLMPYSSQLYGIADWFRQMWAESLGKKYSRDGEVKNAGPTPIKALGVIDQHSQLQLYIEGPYDKTITFLSVKKFDTTLKIPRVEDHYLSGHSLNELIHYEELGTKYSLTKENRPNMTITIEEISPYTIGALLFFFELATYYMGELLNVNAFDQPGVELGKNITYALLGRKGYEKYLPEEGGNYGSKN